jgi:hypothetical protein
MRRTVLNRWPTPGTAIALVALFVALSGTAVALPGKGSVRSDDLRRGSVGTRAIANNSVRSSDIRNGNVRSSDVLNDSLLSEDVKNDTLTGDDLNESTLGKVPSAEKADTATTANTANTANSARPSGPAGGSLTGTYPNPTLGAGTVGQGQLKALTASSNTVAIQANGGSTNVTVACPAGTQVISGGHGTNNFGVRNAVSQRSGNGWVASFQNTTAAPATITATAYCLLS